MSYRNMNNIPKITIVTPSYNQGEFIERTIQSVLNQNYPNIEYIICDGGSTDNTIEILNKYSSQISWWCSEKDNGQTDAINKGMKRATGDIVCWINSDDVLLPNSLDYVGNFFRENTDIDFIMGISLEIDKYDNICKKTHTILTKWMALRGAYNINQQGMFWRRTVFERIGYLDATYHACMDAEFTIRIIENSIKYKVVNKALGAIRVYQGTKTSLGGAIWEKDWEKIKKTYGGYVRTKFSITFVIYAVIKFVRGYYINDFLFVLFNKNKKYYQL